MGEAPELDGFFVAAGFNSLGILTGGGAGSIMASWIVDGEPPVDVTGVDIARLQRWQTNRSYLTERSVELLGRLHSTGSWPHSQPSTARGVRRSPLHDRLVAAGARFAESSGWENASYFTPIDATMIEFRYTYGRPDWFEYHAAEHRSVRDTVGMFDMSAMSKFLVQGSDAESVLNRLSGNDVAVPVGRCVYTQWMNQRGGVMADVTITRLADDRFQVVAAEAFHRRVESMLARAIGDGSRADVTDVTSGWALLSVQGPNSRDLLAELTTADLSNAAFPYLTATEIDLHRSRALAVRMSFVGSGWELFVPTEFSAGVYDRLVEVGAAHGLAHVGMATLESTRTEAGRLDYGLDMENSDSPLEAGLKFTTVDFDKPGGFVGRDALLAQYEQRPYRNRLVQFLLDDPEPLLHGEEPILIDGDPVGYVRSGAYGHTLGGAMGFGYVEHADGVTGDLSTDGNFEIVVAGERFGAQASLRSMYDPTNERVRM